MSDTASDPNAPSGFTPDGSTAGRSTGTTDGAGTAAEKGERRVFPCEQCGGDLVFNIGVQKLKCEFCGHEQEIVPENENEIAEYDYNAALARLKERKESERKETQQQYEIRCSNCGATVLFDGTLTSSHCAYCRTPLQRDNVHESTHRIPVEAMLPFLIDDKVAAQNLRAWIKSLWFAPNLFLRQGIDARFSGVYLPFFTFDSMTFTLWSGQRGEHYYVTVGTGKEQRTERRTRWWPVSGRFQRFFDDVLVLAVTGLNRDLMVQLEPWPLEHCKPFSAAFLAGLSARTYDIPLDQCFADAKQRIDAAIYQQVRQEIGGDEQSVSSVKSQYNAVTFKHLLLPAWLLTYRFHNRVFHVFVNATTGEVQGERPYSWVKIFFFTLFCLLLVGAGVYIYSQTQR